MSAARGERLVWPTGVDRTLVRPDPEETLGALLRAGHAVASFSITEQAGAFVAAFAVDGEVAVGVRYGELGGTTPLADVLARASRGDVPGELRKADPEAILAAAVGTLRLGNGGRLAAYVVDETGLGQQPLSAFPLPTGGTLGKRLTGALLSTRTPAAGRVDQAARRLTPEDRQVVAAGVAHEAMLDRIAWAILRFGADGRRLRIAGAQPDDAPSRSSLQGAILRELERDAGTERRQHSGRPVEVTPAGLDAASWGDDSGPDDNVLDAVASSHLLARAHLTDEESATLALHLLSLREEEIAAELGVSARTVRRRLASVRTKVARARR